MTIDPHSPQPGETVVLQVTDRVPWAYVLLAVNGQAVPLAGWRENPDHTWTWEWDFALPKARTAPGAEGTTVSFYHDCATGCKERGRLEVGYDQGSAVRTTQTEGRGLTKLGVVFANPQRDWHGQLGWDVELTYAREAEKPEWGIDWLAAQVFGATAKGLRVLVRVDYDRGQSLPPAGDQLALTEYLSYLRRLARDDRLRDVYGFIVGSGYNALDGNAKAPDRPVTATWYARLFNGYGEGISRADNVVQTVRQENPHVRVLVGPVRPWCWDQAGEKQYAIHVPWLDYLNTLVAALDKTARAKAAAGIPFAAPDGFALQVPGRPGAPELAGQDAAAEPTLDLRWGSFGGAQAGFRLYQDWLAVINSYPTTRGLPAYITSTNTFAPDDRTPPAQNYPRGWLTAALQVVNAEPQIQALCWFVDGPLGDSQWDWFSLARRSARMIDAAEEFDALLQAGS
jgi:hypothetical protein